MKKLFRGISRKISSDGMRGGAGKKVWLTCQRQSDSHFQSWDTGTSISFDPQITLMQVDPSTGKKYLTESDCYGGFRESNFSDNQVTGTSI